MSEEILIVDDNSDIRNIINELILDAGYKTRLSANYNQALAEIDKKKIRIGGMVKKESILIQDKEVKFIVTDFKNEINVIYSGVIPNLFAEGKGVVAEGFLKDKNLFLASKILAKHDENYMPPEVKAALEEK